MRSFICQESCNSFSMPASILSCLSFPRTVWVTLIKWKSMDGISMENECYVALCILEPELFINVLSNSLWFCTAILVKYFLQEHISKQDHGVNGIYLQKSRKSHFKTLRETEARCERENSNKKSWWPLFPKQLKSY